MILSIITVNYNNLEGLKRTYESVVNQTWTDYEWLIIDGGSTDGSKEFIEAHQDRFTYWCSESDKGVYNAMNKGIKLCNGEYINFMNSGDIFYEPTTLETVFAEEHEADIVYGDWMIKGNNEEFCRFECPLSLYSFFHHNICHQALFIRTIYHKEHLYDESYKLLADLKNWVFAILHGYQFSYVPIVICKYDNNGMSSNNIEKCVNERHRLFIEEMPVPVYHTLLELDYYKTNRQYRVVEKMLRTGILCRFIIKATCWVYNRVFSRIQF